MEGLLVRNFLFSAEQKYTDTQHALHSLRGNQNVARKLIELFDFVVCVTVHH